MLLWKRLVAVFSLVLVLAGCAGMAQYPLGIPASSSPKFYASMEAVAASHNMMISRHDTSLNIQTAEGDWLQYMQQNGAIVLVVIAETDGLDEAGIEKRKADLKRLSDQLVEEARDNAADASVFD